MLTAPELDPELGELLGPHPSRRVVRARFFTLRMTICTDFI